MCKLFLGIFLLSACAAGFSTDMAAVGQEMALENAEMVAEGIVDEITKDKYPDQQDEDSDKSEAEKPAKKNEVN